MLGHHKIFFFVTITFLLFSAIRVDAQQFARHKINQQTNPSADYSIITNDLAPFKEKIKKDQVYFNHFTNQYAFKLTLTYQEFTRLKPYIDKFDVRTQNPETESFLSDFFPEVNAISAAKITFPEYFNIMDTISIKENAPVIGDIDLLERILLSELSGDKTDQHATDMATIIAGNGNTYYSSLGIAPAAIISSTSFNNLFPDPLQYLVDHNIKIQNHSYGLEVEDYYGIEAQAYDDQVFASPDQIHIFSAGNRGLESGIFSTYAAIDKASTLSGTFKHAKNVLAVGAIDSFSQVLDISSRGPAYDGRIKPELVAYGYAGTSDAAAITSGCALIIRNALEIEGMPSDFSTVRSILIAGAEDVGRNGPDFDSGFGKVNLVNSLRIAKNQDVLSGTASEGDTISYKIGNATNITHLVLSWTDPPAEIDATSSIVNDLNIEILKQDGTVLFPVLMKYLPEQVEAGESNTTGRDSINTIEWIDVEALESFTIRVIGHKIKTENQDFRIAIARETEEQFQFIFPFENANIEPLESNQILINGVDQNNDVVVEIDEQPDYEFPESLVFENEYASISGSATKTNGNISEVNFTVSSIPKIEFAWKCEDSIRFQWQSSAFSDKVEVLKLEGTELKVIDSTENAYYTVLNEPQQFYAVRYKISDERSSPHSLVFNTSEVNSSCLFQLFSGELMDDAINLSIRLVAVPPYTKLSLEKLINGVWTDLISLPEDQVEQSVRDVAPRIGLNSYRLVFNGANGTSYSNVVEVFYLPEDEVVVWPTFTTPEMGIDIVQGSFRPLEIVIYNTNGQLLKRQELLSEFDFITLEGFPTGLFFYVLIDENTRLKSGKIMVVPE